MSMNTSEFAVFVINYKADNTYGVAAFKQAQALITEAGGFIEIGLGVYLVRWQSATRALLTLYAQEAARLNARLQFVLVPCGTHTFGELPEAAVQALVAAGLTHSDTTVPARPQRG